MVLSIAWGITGCGDHLEETLKIMEKVSKTYNLKVKVVLSKDGQMVVKWYNLWDELKQNFPNWRIERGANLPFLVGDLQLKKFDFLLICPATGNTTAKIAYGIADSLITNAVAQAMKAKIPVYIYPADQKKGDITTILPNGKELTLSMRDIDIENVEKLRRMEGITVLNHPKEIEDIITKYIEYK